MTVSGKVEKKGDKFSGSVLLNGTWLNFKKGVNHKTVEAGRVYQFELEPWEFKGKTGQNIVSFTELPTADVPSVKRLDPSVMQAVNKIGRDFDKENRGKVKSLFLEALLSNPNVMQGLDQLSALNDEEVQEEIDKLVESVF